MNDKSKITDPIIGLIKMFENQKRLQEKCKHGRTKTLKNSGDYKLKISCIDCGKLLKYKFKEKFKKYKTLDY